MTLNGFYSDKRVLVTGHTGFKGAWLTEWLLMMGAKVAGIGLMPNTDPALFHQLGLANRCDHRIGDIRDAALLRTIVHSFRPDVIFHLAAQPLVRLSYVEPLETYETNVMGTAHVLDALKDADWPCATVMITTDKVYENKENGHAYCETDPLGGYDPYSSSKACAELVIQSYRNAFYNPVKIAAAATNSSITQQPGNPMPRIGVASARAGNVIGGGDWALDRIVPDCMRALAKGKVISVRNPQATRPWQHVLEPLSGYLVLGRKLHDALTGDISRLASLATSFNFGPAVASSRPVGELVEEVLKHWPGEWRAEHCEGAPHEAGKLNLATEKALHELGWRPKWDFARTINETVMWYKAVADHGENAAGELTRQQIASYYQS